MRNLLPFSLALLVIFSSCNNTAIGPEGPRGPQGPVGPKGEPGENSYLFEWSEVNFTAPNYQVVLPYPDDFEGLESDVALVYLLWGTYETNNGEVVEIWRPLPQNVLTENGLLIYNYDFSKYDVRLFLDAEFSLDLLGAIDTDNWIVRVVVVPGDFWNGRVAYPEYQELVQQYGLPNWKVTSAVQNRRN